MRAWLDEHATDAQRAELRAALSDEHRGAYDDPLVSAWYPESMLRDALGAAFVHVCQRDPRRYVAMVEGATAIGVNRFFRILLRLSTLSFVTKLVPTMWRQIRRGRGMVDVQIDDDVALVRYRDFPPLTEQLYQEMTVGSLRSVVRIATGAEPEVRIVAERPDGIDVAIRLR